MIAEKLRVFRLLLYKNFLVRKRHWKMALFVEVLIPLLLFASIWGLRNYVARPPHAVTEKIYPVESKGQQLPKGTVQLNIVPDNMFTEALTDELRKCLKIDPLTLYITRLKKEEDIFKVFNQSRFIDGNKSKYNQTKYIDGNVISVIFENKKISFETKDFKYRIQMPKTLSKNLYKDVIVLQEDEFIRRSIALQLCLDESLIKIKGVNSHFNILIYTQKMPTLGHMEPDIGDKTFRQLFCAFALLAFLFPLCVETSNAANEKFLGTNVLMAMNGVPNYMNLLSWLVSGLIFSIFYTVPIIVLLNFSSTNYAPAFLYYGNPFIYWLVLTLHVPHLIAFGMHISAYFTRSVYVDVGVTVLYMGTSQILKFGIKENAYPIVPYLGIIFPNMLLHRAFEEINYYETIIKGVHFHNFFRVGNPSYGCGGSVGMILILSIIGTIFHMIVGNYVYIINPGKYGSKKHPFYFCQFLRKDKKPHCDRIENLDFSDTGSKPFESIGRGVYVPGIQIRNLKKNYDISLFNNTKIHALKSISVDFLQGQITALLGHNGAGKTTIMSILTGMLSPNEGLVFINGKNIKDSLDEIMNDIGLCAQENMLFPSLSVAQQLKFFGMLKNKSKSMSEVEEDVKSLLHKLKMYDKRKALPKQLSGGQKRRLCIGMALIGDSSTLILDEPTSGLDPESRRDIWDILLKMRGEKTILLSTHNMEEADILGDRIAIVHNGNLKAYGTPMFLKKLLGRGNIEVTLSSEPWCEPQTICSYLDPQSEVIKTDGGQIKLSIPYTPKLPDSLDEIESKKEKLGVTGMSVSLITLEQVFLKVTQENDADTGKRFKDIIEKVEGRKLFVHSTRALLRKKMAYTMKNLPTVFATLFLLVIPLLLISFILTDHTTAINTRRPVLISLDMYHDPQVCYKTTRNSTTYGLIYESFGKKLGGKTIESLKDTRNFTSAIMEFGAKHISNYDYRLLAGAEFSREFNVIRATALYNTNKAQFAQPVAINLVTNALLKTLVGEDHSIRMSFQELPHKRDRSVLRELVSATTLFKAYAVAIVLATFLYYATALFVIHPMRESRSDFKHLQRMTGVSYFNYWGSMFAFDFILYLIMTIIVVVGFVIMDAALGLGMFGIIEVLILTASLVLLAINLLPLVYIFSFSKTSIKSTIRLLILLPQCFVSVELIKNILIELYGVDSSNIYYRIQKELFAMVPYVSFFNVQTAFFKIVKTNADCKQMSTIFGTEELCAFSAVCCAMNCTDGVCKYPLHYYNNFNDNISLEANLLSMCISPKIYFILLSILEYKVIQRLVARLRRSKPKLGDETFEEGVKRAKENIAREIADIKTRRKNKRKNKNKNKNKSKNKNKKNIDKFDEINIENGCEDILSDNEEVNNHAFLAYELRKLYGRFVAVQDLSFGVGQSECFGLLGVNGSGKTTTFKMITGEIIPNNGKMYLDNKNIRKKRKYLLSRMGYCPQHNAIIKSLNAFDHLRLFARIRGIPEDKVDTEVQKWINRVNLKACASQPSGTLSGGNKRRLNVAMALIGMPNLILLDEPTTGIDPAARRSLWNVIQSCQVSGQAVILSSHSMEECEALCNRLAIMVDGKLECIGASQELKQRFGAGYNIQLKLNPGKSKDDVQSIKQDVDSALSCEIMDENSGYLMYHVPSTDITWRQMYDVVTELKNKYTSIEDFSVLSSTLEQLFLFFAKAANRSNRESK